MHGSMQECKRSPGKEEAETVDPWNTTLKFQISELRETRWMLPEEGHSRLAPGLHRSLNYPEDGEKQAQQEVVRGDG